jgi:hypothetical protein
MNPITVFLTIACLAIGAGLAAIGYLYPGIAVAAAAIVIGAALKMANTWEKFVILRAGKLRGVKGPGLFLIIPVIDHVVAVIDERIQTTGAEAALTKDTVPVNVDAIIFWFVHDAQKAALNITNYREAIDRVAQTSLREMIGSSMLAALLSERTAADDLLRGEIGRKTADWGISQRALVALEGENVIGFLVEDFLGDVALAADGVGGNDGAFDHQHVEKRRNGDDLVGLVGHFDLAEHEALACREGGHHVDRRFFVGGAAQRLAVDGDYIR